MALRSTNLDRLLAHIDVMSKKDLTPPVFTDEYIEALDQHSKDSEHLWAKTFTYNLVLTAALFLYLTDAPQNVPLFQEYFPNITGIPELICLGCSLLFFFSAMIYTRQHAISRIARKLRLSRAAWSDLSKTRVPFYDNIFLLRWYPDEVTQALFNVFNFWFRKSKRHIIFTVLIGIPFVLAIMTLILPYFVIQFAAWYVIYNSYDSTLTHLMVAISVLFHIGGMAYWFTYIGIPYQWTESYADTVEKKEQ